MKKTNIFLSMAFAALSWLGLSESALARSATCESQNQQYASCFVGYGDVYLVAQLSHDSCIEGSSWGYNANTGYVWVNNGCRATFESHRGYGDGGRGGRGGERTEYITCSSDNKAYTECGTRGRIYSVVVDHQISSSTCSEGYSWGYTDRYIWVDKGCRASFRISAGRW